MPKKQPKRIIIDELTTLMRKPSAAPLIRPKEAISVALSLAQPGPARMISPDGPMVHMVLLSLKLAGYKIEPR